MGGKSTKDKTYHGVCIFFFHKLKELLHKGFIIFNKDAMKFRHSEGPQSLPDLQAFLNAAEIPIKPRTNQQWPTIHAALLNSEPKDLDEDAMARIREEWNEQLQIQANLDARKTDNAGYTHRPISRQRIAASMQGNVGQERTEEEKGDISMCAKQD